MPRKDYKDRAKQYDNYEKVKHVRRKIQDIDTDVEDESVQHSLTEADIRLESVENRMEDRETIE